MQVLFTTLTTQLKCFSKILGRIMYNSLYKYLIKECVKLRASRVFVLYVSHVSDLRSYVPYVLTCLRASIFYMSSLLYVAYVPLFFCVSYVPTFFTCLTCLPFFTFLTCLHFFMCLMCFHFSKCFQFSMCLMYLHLFYKMWNNP